ncbi:hypothetical protein CerSpe_214920 [Prunus speciosa]
MSCICWTDWIKIIGIGLKKMVQMLPEEVVQKLVDIVHFLHLEIHEAFGSADDEPVESSRRNHKKLGPSGISLQYASIITQINTLEPSETLHGDMVAPSISAAGSFQKELTNQVPNNEGSESSENHMTDEQRE